MSFTLRNRHGERLDATFHPGRAGDRRMVVIGHGVTSHKDRPWLIALSDALSAHGVASVRISFAGNGDSEGRFADATIHKEVDDLVSVLDALADRVVVYAGHSMGGAVGVLCAARDLRVRALVSLAGMVHVRSFMRAQFGHLQPGEPMLGKSQCPWSPTLLAEARAIGDLREQAASIAVPWLLVHGTDDELVPLQDSHDARAAAHDKPQLVELPGADHRFAGHEAAMASAVVAWVLRQDLGEPVP